MIIVIDNYDSFSHNLARYFRIAGAQTKIFQNDRISVEECLAMNPDGYVISPGPDTPGEAGISMALIKAIAPAVPFLGVCLGHQCMIEAFGGQTRRADFPLHGEASMMHHTGGVLFDGIASPTPVGRYHSLVGELASGSPLNEIGWSADGELMAVAHHTNPWFGVQFHPESLLTSDGLRIIRNFVALTQRNRS